VVNLDAETRRVNEVSTAAALTPTTLLGDFGIGNPTQYGFLTGQFQTGRYNQTRDVIDQFVTSSAFTNSNVDLRGRVGSTGVYGSVSNLTNQGSIRYLGGYNRNSARANIDHRFGDRLSLGLQTFYSTQRLARRQPGREHGPRVNGANAFFRITRQPSFIDLTQRDQQGRLYVRSNPLAGGEQNANPLYDIDNNQQVFKGTRFLGGSTVKYDPFEWVTLEANFSYDRQNGDYVLLNDLGYRSTLPNPAANNGGIATFQADDESINTSLTATLRRTFFGDLRAAVSGRYIYEQQYQTSMNFNGNQLVVPNLLTAAAVVDQNSKIINSTTQTVRGVAYIGSAQLDFKDRYLVQANLRRGGSSLFGEDQRWANFPGLSASWVVSREPWFPVKNALSLLKFRGAYGETGNRPSFFAQYATYNIGAGGLLTPNTLGNTDLRVERRRETETGVEMEFFNRVGLNVTYALSNTIDQILPVPLALGSGFALQWQNAGTLRNGSLEASLDVPIVQRRDFTWSSRAIFTRLRSRITELNRAPFFTGFGNLQGAENVYRIAKGEEFGTIYGRDFVRSCSQLPSAFQSQCSPNRSDANAAYRPNDDGYVVWVGQGNQLSEGVTRTCGGPASPARRRRGAT
jgi:hypothetical protein